MENGTISDPEFISVRVLFFAQAREQAKTSQANLSFSPSRRYTPKEILDSILLKFPSLKPLEGCIILAKNQTYLDLQSEEGVLLREVDEVAVIPPISAGESECK